MQNSNNKIGFLGIDESNHGRSPEVFVAVYSTIPNDIENSFFPKQREKKQDLDTILENREYIHILLNRDEINLPYEQRKIFIFSSLIKHYENMINTVIIDGDLRERGLAEIENSLTSKVNIVAKANADRTFNIVNIADAVAYNLYKFYDNTQNNFIRNKYEKTLLTIN